ncbi:hypothetical protein ZWY2020_048701 [Hordeum vulgare]|nr:hypothetical protein ZWY2020_048701 [Hordeum vulgare]
MTGRRCALLILALLSVIALAQAPTAAAVAARLTAVLVALALLLAVSTLTLALLPSDVLTPMSAAHRCMHLSPLEQAPRSSFSIFSMHILPVNVCFAPTSNKKRQ